MVSGLATSSLDTIFDGAGEMRGLCRDFDWSRTSLGRVDHWPLSLRTTVATLLASRHPMFLFWGPDLIQFYNDAYRPSFAEGGRHPRALGARGQEFWTEIWDIIGPQIAQVMAGGEATWHEDQLVPIERNGRIEEVYWTYSYGPAYDDQGKVGGVLVICQETTARVKTEHRLHAMNRELEVERSRLAYAFQRAPAFLAVLRGTSYVFELVNDAYYQLAGHRELVGRPVFDAMPETRGQGYEALLDSVVRTGEPYVGRESSITLARVAGAPAEERIVDFVFFPLVEADGSRSGVIVHGVDVTDHVNSRREVERLLEESNRSRADAEAARAAAEAANRAKSEFLAIMSHELRTPLNAIAGYAELIEFGVHGPVTPEQREALARIQKSERHLLGLVNGVLNYARVETGNVDYHVADVPLGDVLGTCEALVAPQARARRLKFGVEGSPFEITVRADAEKVQQVVLNLLSNAIKFTPAGGSIVLACDADESNVFVHVRDTGGGIPANQLTRIFEPFVQLDSQLTRAQEGIGLGLAISRDLARGMGGDLAVTSEVGRGSTFTLTLPRSRP